MIYYKEPSDRWTEVTIWSMGKSLKEIAAKLKRQSEAFPHKDKTGCQFIVGKRCRVSKMIEPQGLYQFDGDKLRRVRA